MIIGGESFVSSSPAFSNDAKNLLVCTGNTVSIFSISTGMQIMELEGHKAPVTSVIVVPTATLGCKILCNCWTSSLDGTICYWDFSLPELIKKVDINLPIFSMVMPHFSSLPLETNEKLHIHCAFVSVEDVKVSVEDVKAPSDKPKASHGQIRMVDLNKSRMVGGPLQETRKPMCLRASMSGGFFGTQKNHKLHIWKVPAQKCKPDDVKKLVVHHTKKLTTLAFHPTERIVAGGDITGRILVWRGFGKRKFSKQENERKLQNEDEGFGVCGDDDADSCSTWHWHPNEVKFLSFSSDGAYLYSGGKEGVLVIWQLDTGKNKFLPRIGSPLLYFTDSLDPTISAISCADNQIHLLRMPSMEILKSITGIKPPSTVPEICEGMSSGFVFNHASGLVGLPTENYCVQFYSLYNKREVSQVQICERNYQPLDDVTVALTQVTLSKDGSLMGTVEVKLPEEGIGGLVSLKFWAYGSCSRVYSLSTVIYEPHSEAGISDLAFHPSRSMAVSSSFGGDFKIWVHSHIYQQKDQNPGWRCQSVGSYKKHPMTAAVFSPDGSVLAVAAETVVTLWNPETNVLVAVIGETLMPIVTLSFVGKSEHLVSLSRGSNPQLSVWNMSALSISWSYKLHAEAVACSSNSSHFAVLALAPEAYKQFESVEVALESGDGVILLFDAQNPIPNFTWFAKKAKGGGLAFLEANPSPHDETDTEGKAPAEMLVYLNGDHEYVIFDPHGREDENQSSTKPRKTRVSLDEETEQFGYASIYGELPEFKTKRDQIASIPFVPSDKPWETVFSGSSHALPPLSKLCLTFLSSLLEKRTTVQQ